MPKPLVPPALDPAAVPARTGSRYPEPFRAAVAGREKRALGDAVGLTRFGVNLVRLPPGTASAQRHWHRLAGELGYVLAGELTLVTPRGGHTLRPGLAPGRGARVPAGKADGPRLVNRSAADAVYLEIGDRAPGEEVEYPGIDLRYRDVAGKDVFTRKDGTPY